MKEVWKTKFGAGPGGGPGPGPGPGRGPPREQSNVDLAVLDASGALVCAFDAFRQAGDGRGGDLAEATTREIAKAKERLKLTAKPIAAREPVLPDLDGARGVRLFVVLKDDRMRAYQAPIVEVVPTTEADDTLLAYPEAARKVAAASLKSWLAEIYPSGVMERVDPQTKRVYAIKSTEGALSLAPRASGEKRRYALLSGEVTIRDEGPGDFAYSGTLRVVLTYDGASPRPRSIRGVFEGVYPRPDKIPGQFRRLPLVAVLESIPE